MRTNTEKTALNSDDLNLNFIFSTTFTDLLVEAVNKEIDLIALANHELQNRGLDKTGTWVGFNKAKGSITKTTLAMTFKVLATKFMPHQDDLLNLDDAIDSVDEIDEIMFRKSEYIGGMAAVILSMIESGVE